MAICHKVLYKVVTTKIDFGQAKLLIIIVGRIVSHTVVCRNISFILFIIIVENRVIVEHRVDKSSHPRQFSQIVAKTIGLAKTQICPTGGCTYAVQ